MGIYRRAPDEIESALKKKKSTKTVEIKIVGMRMIKERNKK
jgi:hypothetical protein